MSRPRYYWHNMVRKQIQLNRGLSQSEQRDRIRDAMAETNAELKAMPDGELRLKAVKDILIDNRYTYEGEALEVNYSAKTVKRWINAYVNSVGRKAGY